MLKPFIKKIKEIYMPIDYPRVGDLNVLGVVVFALSITTTFKLIQGNPLDIGFVLIMVAFVVKFGIAGYSSTTSNNKHHAVIELLNRLGHTAAADDYKSRLNHQHLPRRHFVPFTVGLWSIYLVMITFLVKTFPF